MKKYLLLTVCIFLTIVVVAGNKNPCAKEKPCQSRPARMEEIIFMFSSGSKTDCDQQKNIEKAMVEFYKWYLKNASWINAAQQKDKNLQDVVPPFNISWQVMQQYVNFIQKNYPAIDTLRVTAHVAQDNNSPELEMNVNNDMPLKK